MAGAGQVLLYQLWSLPIQRRGGRKTKVTTWSPPMAPMLSQARYFSVGQVNVDQVQRGA